MKDIQSVDDILKQLGLDPSEKTTIAYKMWKPWERDMAEHKDDPQGFRGSYGGYKVAEKMISSKEGKRVVSKLSVFDVFQFDNCMPPPTTGETGWALGSSFMLEELKKVEPGVEIAIIFTSREANAHGGKTNNIDWYFVNPADRETRVSSAALPPANASQMQAEGRRSLPANGFDSANGAQNVDENGIPF